MILHYESANKLYNSHLLLLSDLWVNGCWVRLLGPYTISTCNICFSSPFVRLGSFQFPLLSKLRLCQKGGRRKPWGSIGCVCVVSLVVHRREAPNIRYLPPFQPESFTMCLKGEQQLISRKNFFVVSPFPRYFWTETGGHGPIWEEIREPAGAHAGGAVRGLHPTAGAEGRGPLPTARPGKPRQGAPGRIRLWREALLRQVCRTGHGLTDHPSWDTQPGRRDAVGWVPDDWRVRLTESRLLDLATWFWINFTK